jgi:hypothetical protein
MCPWSASVIEGGHWQSVKNPSHTALRRVYRAASRIGESTTVDLGVLGAERMETGIYRAAVMVDGTMRWNAQLYVPNRVFEVGAEKPDAMLEGIER